MKCRYCKRDIPDNSIFCNWCGKRQVKDKDEISVPKPTKLADGTYTGRIMVDGVRTKVPPQPTEAKYFSVARAMKQGLIEIKNAPVKISLEQACKNYIKNRNNILSPSTINGYNSIVRTRFLDYMSDNISSIKYQEMVNEEAELCSAKTLKNAWGFVGSVLRENKVEVPELVLPQIVKKDLPWLDDDQIKVFLKGIEGRTCEIGALLGLHGLRRSEILAITPSKIRDGVIYIEGSVVRGESGMVEKETNKNSQSRRSIPIMIPRLSELIEQSDKLPDERYIKGAGDTMYDQIMDVCEKNGLPKVGLHGLRRSFVSLAFSTLKWTEEECMLYGGWDDYETMHEIYIKISQKNKTDAIKSMADFYSA